MKTTENIHDVIIVGGGIVGAGIFRDLALHQSNVLLLEKGDFASQTSQYSSKMLHGGIRYLENFDFLLVMEALREKNLWLKLAPHLTRDVPFCMPIFRESKYPLVGLLAGLTLYDALSFFQNKRFQILGKKKTIKTVPIIRHDGLSGSGIYHDAIVDDAKITLESIYDGLIEKSAHAENYQEVVKVTPKGDLLEVISRNELTGEEKLHLTKDIIFATGPFTDHLLPRLGIPWSPQLLPSKGIHLWIDPKKLPLKNPVVLQTKDDRVVFIIPHQHAVLVGTTETKIQGDFFKVKVDASDITYLLEITHKFFPDANITEEDILSSYAGIRPLVRKKGSRSLSKTSRNHRVYHPSKNMHVIIGGKLTTFRTMGQPLCKMLLKKNSKPYDFSKTKVPFRQQSVIPPFENTSLTIDKIRAIIKKEKVKTFDDLIKRRLGLLSRKHWNEALSPEDFFLPHLAELKKSIVIDEKDIRNF